MAKINIGPSHKEKKTMYLAKGMIYPKEVMETRLRSELNNPNLKKTKWKILPNNMVMFEGFEK